jgi:Tol biopolymer transport system component/serine/threonine protein kinase
MAAGTETAPVGGSGYSGSLGNGGSGSQNSGDGSGEVFGYVVLGEVIGRALTGELRQATGLDGSALMVKLLAGGLADDPRALALLRHDCAVVADLANPHVLPVRGVIAGNGRVGLVMNQICDDDLRRMLRRRHTLPAAEAAELTAQVLVGLQHAHQAGIVHGDIRPENVVLDGGRARIVSFGLARLLDGGFLRRAAEIPGSGEYAAPELFDVGRRTPASDVYSVGCLLYELIAGVPPTAVDVAGPAGRQRVNDEVSRLSKLPAPLWKLVAAMLAEQPTSRPAAARSADDLRRMLSQLEDIPALPTRPAPPPPSHPSRPSRRTRQSQPPPAPSQLSQPPAPSQESWPPPLTLTDTQPRAIIRPPAVSGFDDGFVTDLGDDDGLSAMTRMHPTRHRPGKAGRRSGRRRPSDHRTRNGILEVSGVVAVVLGLVVWASHHSSHQQTQVPIRTAASNSDKAAVGTMMSQVAPMPSTPVPSAPVPSAAAPALPRSATPLPAASFAWASEVDGNRDIYTGDAAGHLQRLTTAPGPDVLAALSPDRRTIIYMRQPTTTLRIMGADGSGNRPLFTTGPASLLKISSDGRPSWSPDGRSIVVSAAGPDGAGLYVISLDGGTARRLPTPDRVSDPAWSPDGSRVVYWASPSGNGGALWSVASAGGSQPVQLTGGGPGVDADPAWSPDGSKIAFRRDRNPATGNSDVWVMNADGTNKHQLTDATGPDQDPSWSPDGKMIAFSSERDGHREIYVMNADGSGQQRVPGNATWNSAPSWR